MLAPGWLGREADDEGMCRVRRTGGCEEYWARRGMTSQEGRKYDHDGTMEIDLPAQGTTERWATCSIDYSEIPTEDGGARTVESGVWGVLRNMEAWPHSRIPL